MEVILAVTKTCRHCPVLEQELKKMGVPYCVRYDEDNPEMVAKYKIMRSPVIIVDGEIAFSGMPALIDLERFFAEKKTEEETA